MRTKSIAIQENNRTISFGVFNVSFSLYSGNPGTVIELKPIENNLGFSLISSCFITSDVLFQNFTLSNNLSMFLNDDETELTITYSTGEEEIFNFDGETYVNDESNKVIYILNSNQFDIYNSDGIFHYSHIGNDSYFLTSCDLYSGAKTIYCPAFIYTSTSIMTNKVNEQLYFSKNSNHRVNSITRSIINPSTQQYVNESSTTFGYSNNKLTSILIYKNSELCGNYSITYNDTNSIVITDLIDQKRLTISFTQFSFVSEITITSTVDNSILFKENYSIGMSQSTVTDNNGNTTTYLFASGNLNAIIGPHNETVQYTYRNNRLVLKSHPVIIDTSGSDFDFDNNLIDIESSKLKQEALSFFFYAKATRTKLKTGTQTLLLELLDGSGNVIDYKIFSIPCNLILGDYKLYSCVFRTKRNYKSYRISEDTTSPYIHLSVRNVKILCCYPELEVNYDSRGNVIFSSENGVSQTFEYDEKDKLISSSGGIFSDVENKYDSATHRLLSVSGPHTKTKYTSTRITSNNYDATTSIPTFTFDVNTCSQVVGKSNNNFIQESKELGPFMNLVSENDSNRTITTYSRDSLGRVTSKTIGEIKTINTRYVPNSFKIAEISETDQENSTSYSYNSKNLISRVDVYDDIPSQIGSFSYEYEPITNSLTGLKVGNKYIEQYFYQLSNNEELLTKKLYHNGEYFSFTYDSENRLTSINYNSLTNSTYSFSYDDYFRLSSVTDYIQNIVTTFDYDDNDRLIDININDECSIHNTYNCYNELETSSLNVDGKTIIESYSSNERGQVASILSLNAYLDFLKDPNVYVSFIKKVEKESLSQGKLRNYLNNSISPNITALRVREPVYSDGVRYFDNHVAALKTVLRYDFGRESINTFGFWINLDDVSYNNSPVISIADVSDVPNESIVKILCQTNSQGINELYIDEGPFKLQCPSGWHFVCVSLDSSAGTVSLSIDRGLTISYQNQAASRICPGFIFLNQDNYLTDPTTICLLSTIALKKDVSINDTFFDAFYILSKPYYEEVYSEIFASDVINTTSTTLSSDISCYQDYVDDGFIVIPFNNDLDSIDGSVIPSDYFKPITPLYNRDFYLRYNNSLKRFMYFSYGQKLTYNLNLEEEGFISSNVISLINNNQNQCIFDIANDDKQISLYKNGGYLYVKVGDNSYSTGIELLINTPYRVSLSYKKQLSNLDFDVYVTQLITGITDSYHNSIFYDITGHRFNLSIGSFYDESIPSFMSFEGLMVKNCYLASTIHDEIVGLIKPITITNQYDEFSRSALESIKCGNQSILTKRIVYQLNSDNRTTYIPEFEFIRKPNSSIDSFQYVNDSLGRLTEKKTNGTRTNLYSYDVNGYLSEEFIGSPGGGTYYYQYDAYGNISTIKKGSAVIDSYTYDSTNPYLIKSHTYNNETKHFYYPMNQLWPSFIGDTILSNGQALSYMGKRLTRIDNRTNGTVTSSSEFFYNESGELVKYINGDSITKYYYLNHRLVLEVVTSNNITTTKQYFYNSDGDPIYFKLDDTIYYYIKDIYKNILGLIDSSSNIVATYSYDAYGNLLNKDTLTSVGLSNSLIYKGYLYLHSLSWYYLTTRFYIPSICRFLTPDSSDYLEISSVGGLNLYAYCKNDPINGYDPSGHSVIRLLVAVAIGIAIFAVLNAKIKVITGTITQIAISLVCYIGFSILSIFSKNIREDMNSIGWNPFNSDADSVLDSNCVSFYKGVPIIRWSVNGRSGSFGVIFLDKNANETSLNHERGHSYQFMCMGPASYGLNIFLPSAFTPLNDYYYTKPWEITADYFGGVDRGKDKKYLSDGLKYFIERLIFGF